MEYQYGFKEKSSVSVIPAEAGIQVVLRKVSPLDSCLCRNDDSKKLSDTLSQAFPAQIPAFAQILCLQ
jgi:hypothetical protein